MLFNTSGERDPRCLLQPFSNSDLDLVIFCTNISGRKGTVDQENFTTTEKIQVGLYKVPYNLIFFPNPHFFKSWFLSPIFPSPTPFSAWYSSQQLQYYREDDIDSPFTFYFMLYSSQQQWYLLSILTTWYSSPTDLIRNFIHPWIQVSRCEHHLHVWTKLESSPQPGRDVDPEIGLECIESLWFFSH